VAITLAEAVNTLLAGKEIAWTKVAEHKGGSVTLDTAGKRRLFEFLLKQDARSVAEGSDKLFPGLIAAWKDEARDPATAKTDGASTCTPGCWRLRKIESAGFGGLTLFSGPAFELDVNGESWCLEGQNGSGKTSLPSAILWALTGRRIREHMGPIEDDGHRFPVLDDSGKQIGEWPPLAAYPSSSADLRSVARVWVRLTFVNQTGEHAEAYRSTTVPLHGEPVVEARVDQRLLRAPQLVETGLLMPCRLAQMGFADRSQSLYDSVTMLTGLDQLADIADGVANQLAHGGRRFLRYAKDQGLELKRKTFDDNINEATKKAGHLGLDLSGATSIEASDLVARLRTLSGQASSEAGHHLETLKSEIAAGIDTDRVEGREQIRKAVATARVLLEQKTDGIAVFAAWAALTNALKDLQFRELPTVLASSASQLDRALLWHRRQTEDSKLRLKALAGQWFTPASGGQTAPADCPLCDSPLLSEQQRVLAKEMEELKQEAESAARKIEDVCAGLEKDLRAHLPTSVQASLELLGQMDPKKAYAEAVLARFADQPPFSDVLVGLASSVRQILGEQSGRLPDFVSSASAPNPAGGEPSVASELRKFILMLGRLVDLAAWWAKHVQSFRSAWAELIGNPGGDKSIGERSIRGQLNRLEQALAKAEPFDDAAKHLVTAADAAEIWHRINAEQQTREAIKGALEPLKDLRALVEAETARSIANLSGRIEEILDRIHLRERLEYRDTALKKKAVHVHGSLAAGMKIDAGLVANTSWLRAILWAFILALREETLKGLGSNPFPLMVLDDPQTTFDPRNKSKWAEEIARIANLPATDPMAMQLFLTTHEREFFLRVAEVEKLSGQQGLIAPVDASSGVATIVNGNRLERLWNEAESRNDDERAREYIRQVRIYVEKLLKFMLRSEGPHILESNLDKLRSEIKKLRGQQAAPFNRKVFGDLLNCLHTDAKPIRFLNNPPHNDDETIGVAEARDVREFWEETLRKKIHDAFHVCADFEAFRGDPRVFAFEPTVAELPARQNKELKRLTLLETGIAAAAKTDGRAGDGLLTLEEWDTARLREIRLPNHEIYQLAAGTLEPVAAIGDFLLVSNYARVNPKNLVVAAVGNRLLARRFNETEAHPDVAVLTSQTVDPYALREPIIVKREGLKYRKIVGTLFAQKMQAIPAGTTGHEIVAVDDAAAYWSQLDKARLFKVNGRSAEPIALDGQFLITGEALNADQAVGRLDGRIAVVVDENGTTYFKRVRRANPVLVILESLNPDGTTPAELLSLDGSGGLPRLTHALPVVEVLFELPNQEAEERRIQPGPGEATHVWQNGHAL